MKKIIDNIINLFNSPVIIPTEQVPEKAITDFASISNTTFKNGWKLIKDAPMDGTKVLLYNNNHWCVAFWDIASKRWKTSRDGHFPNPSHFKNLDSPE